ncbi:MAG: hypothetical protein JXL97_12015 [Bacteroidales bacterium]|nr:hypothetical protein [Bacteroidales bacterium]
MNILISPLNWGIGHATRIVPIIKYLKKTHNVTIAADGNSYFFLKKEFPELIIKKAPSLEIHYSPTRFLMPFKILITIPKLLIFYFKNRKWIESYIKKHKTDVIISDNRFGFFSKKVKSIFITHQIRIAMPKNLRIFSNLAFGVNKLNIEKFNECWIPDKNSQLSGKLSDTKKLKIITHEIGILSRFTNNINKEKRAKYDILIIISGPEPQRTIFEKKITESLKKSSYKTLILSGKPQKSDITTQNNITIKSHVSTDAFLEYLTSSKIIIARAGYSTIMDLIALKKTAIIIPTPGQTEQEYLADYLHNKELFIRAKQDNFDVYKSINDLINKKTTLTNNIKNVKTNINLCDFLDNKLGKI